MSGIYIHIPFCKKACHYCNFHFSTQLKHRDSVFTSILNELILQKDYLSNEKIQSIYLGGGTPSLLSIIQLHRLFDVIQANFNISKKIECTLEANPDDLTKEYLTGLTDTFINRLSIGVQSFFDDDLKWMNRSHHAQQADHCIKEAQDLGLNNITIDLIYGYPSLTNKKWQHNLSQIEMLQIQHFSAYCLTVEGKTALHHQIKMGKQSPMDDGQASEHFNILMDKIDSNKWHHYEISNIAIDKDQLAIHNSNYWKGEKYLGVGPSAHSFNGTTRQWNIANNHLYQKFIEQSNIPFEEEILTNNERANEYIMTSLRTIWGCSLNRISELLETNLDPSWLNTLSDFIKKDWLIKSDQMLTLTKEGKFFADHIASELFFIEE